MFLIKSIARLFAPARTSLLFSTLAAASALAQTTTISIDAGKVTAKMPPTFYGLMTEEINFSYEGGLYGELIRNRTFKADSASQVVKPDDYVVGKKYPVRITTTNAPKFWSALAGTKISLDTNNILNDALNVSLKVDLTGASTDAPRGVANGGYWGIPVKPDTTYQVSFFAKAKGFSGPLTVSLQSDDGKTVYAEAQISGIGGGWKKFAATLTTKGGFTPSKENRFVLSATKSGSFFSKNSTLWLQQVSLMPPTFKNRPNGDRVDISQLLDDAHPRFLRFPGGNYVEGQTFTERFNWKEMVGPQETRPGHRSCWGYWSTDGFGLPEFLGWCQDLNMEPVLAVFAGYTLNHQHVTNSAGLAPYVQEALEEIEYVTGDASTKWGAQRIKDGYPEPFKLRYVEVGNEDWFDRSGSYEWRFAAFHDAIRAKYPHLKIISTMGYEHPEFVVKSRTPDLVDEHYYLNEEAMENQAYKYDSYDRTRPAKVFVGEWATQTSSPTPNMGAALGDAAWMCGMERNADVVLMHCYAPLLVNISKLNGPDRSMQWRYNLIGYDALNSYASPAYYAQKMFSLHQGDQVLATTAQNLPTYSWSQRGRTNAVKSVFYSATRDTAKNKIIVKIVNRADAAQDVKVEIAGVSSVAEEGKAIVLKAANRTETNSINDPQHVVPLEEKVSGLGTSFTHSYPPCSITVLELDAK